MNWKSIAVQLLPPAAVWGINRWRFRPRRHGVLGGSTLAKLPSGERRRLLIFGNGPSLLSDYARLKEELAGADCMVVNKFAEHPLYTELKPQYYVLADPLFFGDWHYYTPAARVAVEPLMNALKKHTSWPIKLIVPASGKHSRLVIELQQNPNFEFHFYNDTISRPWRNDSEKQQYLMRNWIVAPAQTVLNTCVYLAIVCRYSETFLIGANTSFHEDIRIDQRTNKLYLIDRHFYGQGFRPFYKSAETKEFFSVHEMLAAVGLMLQNYAELQTLAEFAGVKVYNATEYSWIDAFPRYPVLTEEEQLSEPTPDRFRHIR